MKKTIILAVALFLWMPFAVRAIYEYRGLERGVSRGIFDEPCVYVYGYLGGNFVMMKSEAAAFFPNWKQPGGRRAIILRYEETPYGFLFEDLYGGVYQFDSFQIFRTSCQ